jgi:hypothetical protein
VAYSRLQHGILLTDPVLNRRRTSLANTQYGTIIVFSPDSPATRRRRSVGSGGESSSMPQVWRAMQYRRSVQGRILLTELETSARTESKRMTNHNTPQLSRMGLPVHCAAVPGVPRLNTRAVVSTDNETEEINVTAEIGLGCRVFPARVSQQTKAPQMKQA